jgi:4-hydroxy-3-polyprenylbenzoate decarboxylase
MPETRPNSTPSTVGLRDFLDAVRDVGELERVTGADWDREMSAISELTYRGARDPKPALLFDGIPGYPDGYRTLYGTTNSLNRLAITVVMTPGYDDEIEFIRDYRGLVDEIEHGVSEEPALVDPGDAPVMASTLTGDGIDLTGFPVPLHHEHDGGRYIGTGNCVITRDRAGEQLNVGTYRMQLFDERSTGLYISPGKHGRLHRDTYFERDEPMPVAMTFGQDPALWLASCNETETGVNEFEYAAGLKGRPYDVIEGPHTGLPIPAGAEIAVEGYLHPDQMAPEGPFGELMGYYRSARCPEP